MVRILRRYKSTIYGNYRAAYLKYGLLTGLVISVVVVLCRICFPEHFPAAPNNYLTEIVLTICVFIAGYLYRRQYSEQELTLKELMLLGLGIGVISSVVYGLFLWLMCGQMFPDVVNVYIENRLAQMDAPETSAEAKVAVELTKGYTAGDWAFIGGFRTAVFSVIVAFAMALILGGKRGSLVEKKSKK